ncbi:MAG: nuclear transport factor 2 family protein [Sphingomicrobium sp.]
MESRFAPKLAQQNGTELRETMNDRLEIRELLENWVLWRDAGDWDRFATVWHDDGRMNATWFQASAPQFIEGCRKAFDSGMVGQHFLGGATIDVLGSRAIAQTKMQIVHRGRIDDVPVDVTCQGRFLDALECRDGRWGLVFRQPVYELDRIAPVDSSTILKLDQEVLQSFPEGYRHLAYLQTQMGFDINKSLPGTRGPEIEALNASMSRWLHGDDQAFL